MDCTDVNFLVLILYHSYVQCYHWGKLDEGYGGLPYNLPQFVILALSQVKKKLHLQKISWAPINK